MMSEREIRNFYAISADKASAFATLLKNTPYTADALRIILGKPTAKVPVSPDNKAIQDFHKMLEEFDSKDYVDDNSEEEVEKRIIEMYNKGCSYKHIAEELSLAPSDIYYKIKLVKQNAPEKLTHERAKIKRSHIVDSKLRQLNKSLDLYNKMASETKKQMEALEDALLSLQRLREDTLSQINLVMQEAEGVI